jgi:hypothetical protein
MYNNANALKERVKTTRFQKKKNETTATFQAAA